MAGKTRTAERAAAAIAARQHGLVTRRQMRACGIGDNTVDRWAGWGRLRPVHRGVFALGAFGLDEEGRVMAAVLACPTGTRRGKTGDHGPAPTTPGALASHRAAGFLLGLVDPLPSVIDVICIRRAGQGIDGIRRHNVAFPGPNERTQIGGVPCTDVARTLVDLAGMLRETSLRSAVERAATNKALDIAAIETALGRGRRRGSRQLRAILEQWRLVEALARRS